MNGLYAPNSMCCLSVCAMRWTPDKDTKTLIRAAEKAAGWRVKHTSGGHLCFVSPKGDHIFTGTTPSGRASYLNTRSRLRRAGLNV